MPDQRHAQLVTWLAEQGHTADEVAKILTKVEDYDRRTAHQSIFDALDAGEVDLGQIIREALGE